MTQVKSAQAAITEVALRKRATGRTLAQRRAELAAQMRDMALSDLSQVSKRLKDLHAELERRDGKRWTHYDLASAMNIPPRTFQSWENGEVENRDGKGYDKMARWYSRKLGRKITRQWIVFGETNGEKPPGPDLMDSLSSAQEAQEREQLEDALDALKAETGEKLDALHTELAEIRTQLESLARRSSMSGS